MALFNPGDKVKVEGVEGVITSWPAGDEGYFTVTEIMKDGSENRWTHYYGERDGEPVRASVVPVLVEAGGALPPSFDLAQVDVPLSTPTDDEPEGKHEAADAAVLDDNTGEAAADEPSPKNVSSDDSTKAKGKAADSE